MNFDELYDAQWQQAITDLLNKKETQPLAIDINIGDFRFNREPYFHSCEVCSKMTHYIWQGYNLPICSTECLEQKVDDVLLVQIISDWVKTKITPTVDGRFVGDVVEYNKTWEL